ncbi:hypothetical protein F400_gp003 [Bacillus phage BCD7]|uniref:Uncharacterized protein n=1 Tax=Bacillus phage BCD7 TaxID=1136534 RepID=J9PV78_9CAUD|nr:hypothetical protein F400_gp003 [Bacillus phage BCD7]AEZ50450.1 hypothetical protein BCD7_0003 [Bacillus phage BCD7]
MLYIPIEINNPANFDKVFSVQLHPQAQTTYIVYGRNKSEALYNVVIFCMEHNFTVDFFTTEQVWDFFLEDGITFKQVAGKWLMEDSLIIEEIEDYRF